MMRSDTITFFGGVRKKKAKKTKRKGMYRNSVDVVREGGFLRNWRKRIIVGIFGRSK